MNHRKMPRPSQRRRLPLSIKLRPLKIPKAKRSQRKSRSRKQQIALGMLAAMRCVTVERSIGRMTDVNQVRINELARELEVKAKAIIDLLPGYGVTEKKTHSSSIPVDVAEKVRKNILGQAEAEAAADAAAKAEQASKDAAAKAARMRPAAPPAPVAVAPSVAVKPAAPTVAPAAPPVAPQAAPAARPVVVPPAPAPAAPVSAAPAAIPIVPKAPVPAPSGTPVIAP